MVQIHNQKLNFISYYDEEAFYGEVRFRMIAKNYVIIMLIYPLFYEYIFLELIADIQYYLCQIKAMLYIQGTAVV